MTDERTRELMKAKGFFTNCAGLVVFYKDRQPKRHINLSVVQEGPAEYCIMQYHPIKGWQRGKKLFHNPIAAATYANRVVIPALLAGKESA